MFEQLLDYVPDGRRPEGQAQRHHAGAIAAGDAEPEGARQDVARADLRFLLHLRDRPLELEPKAAALLTPETRELIGKLRNALESVTDWNSETTEAAMRNFAEQNNLNWARSPSRSGGADGADDIARHLRRAGGAGARSMPCPARRFRRPDEALLCASGSILQCTLQ